MPTLREWLEAYRAEGLRVIPIFGMAHPVTGEWLPKAPGYPKWSQTVMTVNQLLSCGAERFGVVSGRASGNLMFVDFDLADQMNYRDLKLGALRALDTLVTLSPHGFHVWFRSLRLEPVAKALRDVAYGLPLGSNDLTHMSGGQCLVPPSRIGEGVYKFLDFDETATIAEQLRIRRFD